jgi:hypothetical protein
VNRSGHATAGLELSVGGVNDRAEILLLRDISLSQFHRQVTKVYIHSYTSLE